jgi:uncharacterized protein YbjQ (UPF0145 family)
MIAMTHKLARTVYHLLKNQTPFTAVCPVHEDARYRERALRNLQRQARKVGANIVMEAKAQTA